MNRRPLAVYSEPHYGDHLTPLGLEMINAGTGVSLSRFADVDRVVVASRKDARFFETRGFNVRVALVEHGVGQLYDDRDPGAPPDAAAVPHPNVELFLAPSQRVADNGAVLYPAARRVAVGSPRLEYLAGLERDPRSVVVAFHWDSDVSPEAKSAWPRFHAGLSNLVAAFSDVVGHGHPRQMRRAEPWYRSAGIEIVRSWEQCVERAAVLVCDNSSIIYEACALGIPVVLLNAPWYRRDVEHGLRFWEFADVGPNAETPSQMVDAVHAVLNNDVWTQRRADAAAYCYDLIEGSTVAARAEIDRWVSGVVADS